MLLYNWLENYDGLVKYEKHVNHLRIFGQLLMYTASTGQLKYLSSIWVHDKILDQVLDSKNYPIVAALASIIQYYDTRVSV